jgi:dipeptide/tripeptide permease
MVTELSPTGATSFCMGAWFLTYANGHLLSGLIAASTSGGGESASQALERYAMVFTRVGLAVVGAALLLLLMRRWLNRMIG